MFLRFWTIFSDSEVKNLEALCLFKPYLLLSSSIRRLNSSGVSSPSSALGNYSIISTSASKKFEDSELILILLLTG